MDHRQHKKIPALVGQDQGEMDKAYIGKMIEF